MQFLSSRKENRGVKKFRFFDKVNKKRAAVKAESPALSFYKAAAASPLLYFPERSCSGHERIGPSGGNHQGLR